MSMSMIKFMLTHCRCRGRRRCGRTGIAVGLSVVMSRTIGYAGRGRIAVTGGRVPAVEVVAAVAGFVGRLSAVLQMRVTDVGRYRRSVIISVFQRIPANCGQLHRRCRVRVHDPHVRAVNEHLGQFGGSS